LLSRQQLAAVAICVFCWLILLSSPAAAQAPGPPPRDIAPHKTEALATVKSLQIAADSAGIAADLGTDIAGKFTFTILKLRIHSFHALTSEGTPITDNAVIEAVTRDSVDKDLVGTTVEVELELRGNINRHRWLVTKINPTSSPAPKEKN
jgi:hypothetical protein